jgi:hypothetical protein
MPIAGKVIIGLTPPNTSVYEVVMAAQTAAAFAELVIVSSETSRSS